MSADRQPPVCQCRGLTVSYGAQPVLRAVDFALAAGALLPLVGPNGSGKTTLLRVLLGLERPQAGTLERQWGGRPPGYVPQQATLDLRYPVSARQLIEMGLYPELGPWRHPDAARRERVERLLAQFALAEHQNKTFAELSGGLRQKVLLARALVGGAEALVLDEPTAGLDAPSEREFLTRLRELNQQEGKTILLAHHRLEDLSHLAAEVCVVDRGTVRFVSAQAAGALLMQREVWR